MVVTTMLSDPALTLGPMPVTITERYFDPDDDEPAGGPGWAAVAPPHCPPESEVLWVEPDYGSIPGEGDLPADRDQLELVWPGPAMVMAAGLLPDGAPPGGSDWDNAARITGMQPRSGAEADGLVKAYSAQQNALRDAAGLPRAIRRWPRKIEDTPETLAAIESLHMEEHIRRAALRYDT